MLLHSEERKDVLPHGGLAAAAFEAEMRPRGPLQVTNALACRVLQQTVARFEPA